MCIYLSLLLIGRLQLWIYATSSASGSVGQFAASIINLALTSPAFSLKKMAKQLNQRQMEKIIGKKLSVKLDHGLCTRDSD